jgi:hypothetical protein
MALALLAGLVLGAFVWRRQHAIERQPWYEQWAACVAQLGPPPNTARRPSAVERTDSGWVLHGRSNGIDGRTATWREYDFACVERDGRFVVTEP